MSDTQPTPPAPPFVRPDPPVPPVPVVQQVTPTGTVPDTLYSQAFIYALCLLPLGAGVLIGAFKYLSPEVAATLAGTALGLTLGGPTGYFYGAAKHTSAPTPAPPPGTTTTTTTLPTGTVP